MSAIRAALLAPFGVLLVLSGSAGSANAETPVAPTTSNTAAESAGTHPTSLAPAAKRPTNRSSVDLPLASTTVTDNWAGYVAGGGNNSYTSAETSFTVPTLTTCGSNENSASSFWAGLDGWTSSTVEQAGVAADCTNGVPQYFAWWEDLPLDSGTFLPVNVGGGDIVTARVVDEGAGSYSLSVSDTTSQTSGTVTVSEPGTDDSSAECIAEDPGGAVASIPYANYGTVHFSGCEANGASIGVFGPIATNTVDDGGALDAITSGLSGGTSFSVRRVLPTPFSTPPPPAPSSSPPLGWPVVGMATTPSGNGYWATNAGGAVTAHGAAHFYGSLTGVALDQPVTHIVSTSDGHGYWLVAADGGTFAFGDAGFYGSMGGIPLNAPVVDIAPTPDDRGYWLVASDGGVFAFGDAPFYGSMGGVHLNAPVVGIAHDTRSGGYWLVASDGGVFAFDAPFFGSCAQLVLDSPVLSMAPTVDGRGYWMVAGSGGVFAFGNATFLGSLAGHPLSAPIVGLDGDPSTGGYWMIGMDGAIYAFDTPFYGSV